MRSILDNNLDRQNPAPDRSEWSADPIRRRSANWANSGFRKWPRPSGVEAFGEAAALTHAVWLCLSLDREPTYRRDKRLVARLHCARLHCHQAMFERVDTEHGAIARIAACVESPRARLRSQRDDACTPIALRSKVPLKIEATR